MKLSSQKPKNITVKGIINTEYHRTENININNKKNNKKEKLSVV